MMGSNLNFPISFMGLFSIFKKNKATAQEAGWRVGGMEDFMMLIRVYYQALIASNLGLANLALMPDLRVFKQSLHIPTTNNRLGLAEKNKCKKMLMDIYGLQDYFFKEIDASVKKRCRNANDMRSYLFQFQGFNQELMMLMGNLMKWKFRLPSFFRKALYGLTQRQIHDILTKDVWKDPAVYKACLSVRTYQGSLGYSEQWVTDFVYNIIMLAKKEPKPADE